MRPLHEMQGKTRDRLQALRQHRAFNEAPARMQGKTSLLNSCPASRPHLQ